MTEERKPSNTGGLQIPKGLGAAQSKLDDIAARFSTQKDIDTNLLQMGLQSPVKPSFELPVVSPEALTTTNSREYTELYARQLAWFNYLTPLFASIEVSLLETTNTFELIEASIRDGLFEENKLRTGREKLAPAELSNKVLVHPAYQEALLEVQRMTQYKVRLEALLDVAKRNMTVISRQVEIRRQELEGYGREGNIPRHGRTPIKGG